MVTTADLRQTVESLTAEYAEERNPALRIMLWKRLRRAMSVLSRTLAAEAQHNCKVGFDVMDGEAVMVLTMPGRRVIKHYR